MLFAFEKSPTVISLSYKLVPVLYREYKYDLLLGHGEGVRGGGLPCLMYVDVLLLCKTKARNTLHTAAEPAVRAPGITSSKRHDNSLFLRQATKIKTMLKLLWPLLIVNSRILGLI